MLKCTAEGGYRKSPNRINSNTVACDSPSFDAQPFPKHGDRCADSATNQTQLYTDGTRFIRAFRPRHVSWDRRCRCTFHLQLDSVVFVSYKYKNPRHVQPAEYAANNRLLVSCIPSSATSPTSLIIRHTQLRSTFPCSQVRTNSPRPVTMAVLEPYRGGYYLWKYLPSVGAAAFFCILYVLATLAHVWRIWKTRLLFAIPFAVGGFSKPPCFLSPRLATTYLRGADTRPDLQWNSWDTRPGLPHTTRRAS